MKRLAEESISLLRKMVATASPTFEEAAVADMIGNALRGWGVGFERFGNNIVAQCGSMASGAPVLVLDAHIDTVPAAASYTRDPYEPGDDPLVVYGLGSNDDGGSVVSMIAAFRYFKDAQLPFRLILALTCEEEKAGPHGAAWLYSPEGPLGALGDASVIVGEPTGVRAAVSERGLLVLDGHATGVSGHAARGEGVNALYIALDDITALRAHEFARESAVMGKVHLSVTQISAGTAHNVIPDGCDFVVDVRPTDVYSNEELVAELQGLCRSALTPRSLRNRASATPRGSRLFEAVLSAGLEEFSSPTTSDWIRVPYPAVKIGPGESSRSHKADEFIQTDEIRRAIETYITLISKF